MIENYDNLDELFTQEMSETKQKVMIFIISFALFLHIFVTILLFYKNKASRNKYIVIQNLSIFLCLLTSLIDLILRFFNI